MFLRIPCCGNWESGGRARFCPIAGQEYETAKGQKREFKVSQQLLKKTKKKKTRTVIIIAVLVVLAALGFAGLIVKNGVGTVGTVSVSVDCSDLSQQMDRLQKESIREYIPEDGVILPETDYSFAEGESVYDCLYNTCRDQDIQMESIEDSIYRSRYVEGIGHLYEMDAGKRSGWTYYVNDEMPDVGCSKYELKDGDQIRWVYVVDYTKSGAGGGSGT